MIRHILFDWGGTLMEVIPGFEGPMCQWPAVKAVPGARRCLASLSRRVMCHVATNAADSNESDIRKALERADLDRYLTHIFCYRAIGHKKPGQAYFDTVIDRLGCQPGDVVLIGDSLEQDVLGAMRSGLGAIWFNRSGEKAPTGIKSTNRLQDLPHIIDMDG